MTETGESRKAALITGASAGLGAEFARQLAARRFDLLLVARREQRLASLARELEAQHGVWAEVLAADFCDVDAPDAVYARALELGLDVGYLVNNAGAAGPDLLTERNWSKQAEFFELMMSSVAHMCHLFAPTMQQRGYGRIVNVASVAGRIARGGDNNYGPSKAYLIALSESLALTLKPDGVHVCALCPGFTHTEFHEAAGMLDTKAATPGFIWYDADVVVREGLRAVEKGRSIYVSGRLYRLIDPILQSVWTRGLAKRLSGSR